MTEHEAETAVAEPAEEVNPAEQPVETEALDTEPGSPELVYGLPPDVLAAITDLDRRTGKHNAAKSAAKAAKERMDEAQEHLNALLHDMASGQGGLFDPPVAVLPGSPTDGQSEAWRDVRLDTLDIPAGIVKKLAAAGIETIGQISDYWNAHLGAGLGLIEGIGEVAEGKIDDALMALWEQHPEYNQAAADPTAVSEHEPDPRYAEGGEIYNILHAGRGELSNLLATVTDRELLEEAFPLIPDGEKGRSEAVLERIEALDRAAEQAVTAEVLDFDAAQSK